MKLGDKIRELREVIGITQGQLAEHAAVSQGYLSQLENGDVKNPSAAVLLRVAQAMHVEPDDLFEAAGYPTTRTLRQIYQDYEANIDQDLLQYLARMPRDRQRRLLLLLEGMENLLGENRKDGVRHEDEDEDEDVGEEYYREGIPLSSLQR
ncbi:MAG: helix-turn-helix domain-containing protein [Dehalococcoidia bacterium]